jgi:hypothetical protein
LNHEPLYLLREEVQFRCFADSTVAFHPDTGDTLVLDNECGRVLQVLLGAPSPVGCDELLKLTCPELAEKIEEQEAMEERLAALELHDLVRVVTL